ncbi:MAG: hypothetical protein IJK18_02090 [Clostridia bacterium]|nr:hypothetical protein [Clostridia bacterium]
MIDYSKKSDLKNILAKEKKIVHYYDEFENNIKKSLETYIEEFKDVSLENDVLKTMLINNFASAVIQVDNNIQNIQSLNNIIEILEKQDEVTPTDIDTYNKLFSKVDKDIELLQNFLAQTISGFDNIPITGKKKTINVLNECKEQLLSKIDLSKIETKQEKTASKTSSKKSSNTIKKKIDLSSSDLLCFFPKSNSDSLVISTIQPNYKISFNDEIANIYIEDEDFNLSLKTAGVQISNSNTNNILFVSHSEHKYTIITNSQIELPSFIQVSKISKNDDFLEVEISNSNLSLDIKDNVINFEDKSVDNKLVEEKNVDNIFGNLNNLHTMDNTESVTSEIKKTAESHIYDPIPVKDVAETIEDTNIKIQTDENEVKDNNTLIISDSNQNVVLPYKVIELEEKLKNNKKYKTLQDVIKNEYTLPLETFKNPTKSRFREAFQLIKKKEHGSLKEAIELGFELMFQSDLNPAVIAACKDLDELDIYLDCLDDNELDKFSCFKIEYNVPPTKKGKR